ncbi:hypothetical protein ACEPAF_6575 [Sanghuangporus sanghuang]
MSVFDVSSKLGEYMLKGWVLTDEACPHTNCRVPLMRSPKGHSPVTMFCANCDGDPQSRTSAPSSAVSPSVARESSPSTVSSGTRISRSSTPPTDVSSRLSSPTFALPVETAESVRRREQSDAASAEIGVRLLKGWTMLADECPNERCYGVPLVRPPLVGGRDPRKECVACGTVYVDEKDADGWERLVIAEQRAASSSTTIVPSGSGNVPVSNLPTVQNGRKGKAPLYPASQETIVNTADIGTHAARNDNSTSDPKSNTLETSASALELALQSLSQRLSSIASHPATAEPSAIASTAEAMSKVLQALTEIRKLRGDSRS